MRDAAPAEEPKVLIYDEVPWDRPLETGDPATRPPAELVAQAQKTGSRRKKLVRGEGGFYMNRSVLSPGFRVPPHTHNHDELMIVLAGGCEFDDGIGTLGPNDTIVIHARYRYGFTCGPEGMEFITIRTGEAVTSLDP
jgi:quercetin dioxygenase-like cupin family protein